MSDVGIVIFELGLLTRKGRIRDNDRIVELAPTATTLTLHPLLVAPNSIQWSDTPREDIISTPTGATYNKAGRAPRTCSMSGVFGLESRALGLYFGTGPQRKARFEREIVRLHSATTKKAKDDALAKDPLTEFLSTSVELLEDGPSIKTLKAKLAMFDEKKHSFYVNVYDFFSNRYMQVGKITFQDTRSARGGGPVGLVPYSLSFQEVGPIVVSASKESWLLGKLMTILPTWKALNDFINSVGLTSAINAVDSIFQIPAELAADTLISIFEKVQHATGIMAGYSSVQTPNMVDTFGQIQRAINSAHQTLDAIHQAWDFTQDNDTGAVDWSSSQEGSVALDNYATTRTLLDLTDALNFQRIAGIFYGMSREEYQSFIEAGGVLGGRPPDVKGSMVHTVGTSDTSASISEQYGVGWDELLRLNGMTPDEALVDGTELYIPITRTWGPMGLDGIPVFDSHVGRRILGTDLTVEIKADPNTGDLATVTYDACLSQGLEMTLEAEAESLQMGLETVPENVRNRYIEERVRQAMGYDRRISGVSEIVITQDPQAASMKISVTAQAVNGATVRTQ